MKSDRIHRYARRCVAAGHVTLALAGASTTTACVATLPNEGARESARESARDQAPRPAYALTEAKRSGGTDACKAGPGLLGVSGVRETAWYAAPRAAHLGADPPGAGLARPKRLCFSTASPEAF